ncbi:MAG: hypothetical protein LBD42_04325 [Desulfovibrio sp.]|nr:hypothetical protein [Desulfovibrio sp.]
MFIAGPYEFLADSPYGHEERGTVPPSPPPAEGRRALLAHSLLRIDAGWLSPKAANWMKVSAGKIPPGYHIVNTDTISRVIDTALGKVGIVFFPQGTAPGKAPTREQEHKALAAGRALRGKTALLLGVSPWGLVGEKKFLPGAQGIFDCILGGGEGVAFAHSLAQETPGVLWLRPDGKGRAVNILEILQAPQQSLSPGKRRQSGGPPQWVEDVTFRASLVFLDPSVPSDPAMRRIIGDPATDN